MAMRWRCPPDRRAPALADHGLIAVGQRVDELMGVRGARGGDQVGFRGVGAAEAQVVLDRAMEQVGVLRHHRDHASHGVGVQAAQILATDLDGAGLWVVQAQQQTDNRGLARTAGADDADPLAGVDAEGKALVRRTPTAGIGEGHVHRRRWTGRRYQPLPLPLREGGGGRGRWAPSPSHPAAH